MSREEDAAIHAEIAALDDFDKVVLTKEVVIMTETVQGVVERINKNQGGFYGVKIGEEWFGAGKFEPKFNEGDEVKFGYTRNGKYANMEFGTVVVVNKGSGNSQTSGNSTSSSSGGGSGSTNWDLKDKRITMLASRKDAIELMGLMISSDSFQLPTKKADRYDVVMEQVSNMTQDLYVAIYGEPYSPEGS